MTALRLVTSEPIPSLAGLFNQTWPANRANGDYLTALRKQADLEPRVVICGFCGERSRPLDGPTRRAWFASHSCGPVAA